MDREIKRKIDEICNEVGSAAAEEASEEIIEELLKGYGERVKAGMSELDAYRDVLKKIDSIKEMLDSLPRTEDEQRKKAQKTNYKSNAKFIDKISRLWWSLILLAFAAFTFYGMGMSWLLFLWGAIGQTFFGMIKQYNKGKTLKKVLKSGLSKVLWLAICIVFFGIIAYGTSSWLPFAICGGGVLQVIINILFDE